MTGGKGPSGQGTIGLGLPRPGRRLESVDALPVEQSFDDIEFVTGGTANSRTGYFPEKNWGEIEEVRSCVQLTIQMPVAWTTDTSAVVRVYIVTERVTSLVQQFFLGRLAFTLSDDGTLATAVVRVDGAAPHAWKVTAATKSATPSTAKGKLTMVAYGTCCVDPMVSGEDPSKGLSPGPYPPVSAALVVFDPTSGLWLPGSVSGGSTVTQIGLPTTGRGLDPTNYFFDDNAAHSLKNTAGYLLSLTAQNARAAGGVHGFLQVVNKASALVGGETPLISIFFADGQNEAVPIQWVRPKFFSLGIQIAWSSTETTYTGGLVSSPGPYHGEFT